MATKPEIPSIATLSAMAHAVGKPSFESLSTEQRQRALQAALTLKQIELLESIANTLGNK